MSFGSVHRQHSVQIASLLGTKISESTPTTIYDALEELQRNRDDLATATGTAGKDLSLREITNTVVAHFRERKRYELLEDECTTLRETCRGLQEINKALEGDVDLLRREHITVSEVLAKALDSRRSVPDTLLGRAQAIIRGLQRWKDNAKEEAKRADEKQKEAEKQVKEALKDKAMTTKARCLYNRMAEAILLKEEFDSIWEAVQEDCDHYFGHKGMEESKQAAIHTIWRYLCRNAWGCNIPLRPNSRYRSWRKRSSLEALLPTPPVTKGQMSEDLNELVSWAHDLQAELESHGFQAHIDPVGHLGKGLPRGSGVMICVKHHKSGCLGYSDL